MQVWVWSMVLLIASVVIIASIVAVFVTREPGLPAKRLKHAFTDKIDVVIVEQEGFDSNLTRHNVTTMLNTLCGKVVVAATQTDIDVDAMSRFFLVVKANMLITKMLQLEDLFGRDEVPFVVRRQPITSAASDKDINAIFAYNARLKKYKLDPVCAVPVLVDKHILATMMMLDCTELIFFAYTNVVAHASQAVVATQSFYWLKTLPAALSEWQRPYVYLESPALQRTVVDILSHVV